MYKFEISDGFDLYNRYLFVPVVVADADRIVSEEVTELEPRFSVNAIHVECYLEYFLKKYFDDELSYNKKRITNWRYDDYSCKYEERVAFNFYTYSNIEKMVVDLEQTATILETDFDNPILLSIKEKFDVHYLHDPDSDVFDYDSPEYGNWGEVKDHVHIITDFYRRVADQLARMMKHNPEAFLINIEFGY